MTWVRHQPSKSRQYKLPRLYHEFVNSPKDLDEDNRFGRAFGSDRTAFQNAIMVKFHPSMGSLLRNEYVTRGYIFVCPRYSSLKPVGKNSLSNATVLYKAFGVNMYTLCLPLFFTCLDIRNQDLCRQPKYHAFSSCRIIIYDSWLFISRILESSSQNLKLFPKAGVWTPVMEGRLGVLLPCKRWNSGYKVHRSETSNDTGGPKAVQNSPAA